MQHSKLRLILTTSPVRVPQTPPLPRINRLRPKDTPPAPHSANTLRVSSSPSLSSERQKDSLRMEKRVERHLSLEKRIRDKGHSPRLNGRSAPSTPRRKYSLHRISSNGLTRPPRQRR